MWRVSDLEIDQGNGGKITKMKGQVTRWQETVQD